MDQGLIKAIENKKVIEFSYENESRTVEPHCYGITTAGNEGLRAYQIDGYSSSGKMGWKMYDMGKADEITILDETFETRDGYKRDDKGMKKIFCQI